MMVSRPNPRGPEEEANEERRDNVRARILRCQHGQALAKETCDILVDMWHKGELKDGTDSLGDGFGCLDNGLFYGFLSRDNAPPYNVRRREDDGDSFWSKGEARRRHSDRVFRACLTAGFPVLIEGDITRSVMGAVCKAAVGMHISKLRNLGVRRGTSMFSLSEEFVDCWVEGNVGDNMLRDAFGGKTTWTIQNFEENQRVDACSYQTIECAAATGIVRKTRMGALCYPDTADTAGTDNTGGELTKPVSIGEVLWAGSEVTAFATRRGSVTHIHVDALEVNEKPLFLPAAGAMRSVNRGDRGPAKRAIVVCAHDMDRVVRLFKLDVRKPPAMQYGGAVSDLRRLAAELKANSIGFVVIDFPEACSYAIPGKCAHMSVTLRLVETCAWNPALPF
ncbi:conserved unknown protein [Ectocarpus siliculosus]|uniref:Uncharacterized protein n=1 Tax=Ectocarpus siliculosus TaxID=2880 RepID=D7G7Y6_ECTSI|nr:conserved unknown protein [Ectocarpus siliculosus]|eukprot:CBJ27861.1 conserved unknown protein [Ectocarpus siliculosus]